MNHESLLIAGWYGKIPSLGDFTSRRLPTSFINTWDAWLQHSMTTSRSQLGERWLNLYLTGPIWRFLLMPQVCDDNMWAGILMPSVDKVGRYFPLTIAVCIKPQSTAILTTTSSQIWFASLEQLALDVLNVNTLPDDLDQNLVKLPFPSQHSSSQHAGVQKLAAWWEIESQIESNPYKSISLTTTSTLTELFDGTAKNILVNTGLGNSVWWSVIPDGDAMQLHCFTGLPPESYFSTLLENTVQE